jgi:hypothetical protein
VEPVDPKVFEKEKKTTHIQLENMINLYFKGMNVVGADMKRDIFPELEGRFGTRGKALTKNNYDNVIQKLLSLGFTCKNYSGIDRLSIQTVYLDIETGKFKNSNIRAEIHGITEIQKYCETNSISEIVKKNKALFVRKAPVMNESNIPLQDVLFPEFNFSMSYKMENNFSSTSKVVREMMKTWTNSKKRFKKK